MQARLESTKAGSQSKPGRTRRNDGGPRDLARLSAASTLDETTRAREHERHIFRKMNYLKYRAHRLREALGPGRCDAAQLDEIERLQEEALTLRNQLLRANLRLVVSIAKKHVGTTNNLFELISDGNICLIRAVEKFDYARGNKFSTYASCVIMRNFARTIADEKRRRDRFVTGHEEMFMSALENRGDAYEQEAGHRRRQGIVQTILSRLDDRERRVLISRHGIGGGAEQTLEQLGRELGITKERVRQIEFRAQEKLRRIAMEEKLDPAFD